MKIPFMSVNRVYEEHKKDFHEILDNVYASGQVLMGPQVDSFEKNISQYCNRKYAVAVGSCSDALFFSLKAAGINEGDEVLVTSFSFLASATAILRVGAVPVFVDIEPEHYMMDFSDMQAKLSEKTKAIVAVHLFGQMLDLTKLIKFSEENELLIIEDAAQSLGSSYKGIKAGSNGLCSCISFDPTKIVGAFGTGGVVLTDDSELYKTLKQLSYHGKNMQTGEFEILGNNSRISSYQASLLDKELTWLDAWIDRRQKIAYRYIEAINKHDPNVMQAPLVREGAKHIFHKFVISSNKRDEVVKYFKSKGVDVKIHYANAIYENKLFANYPTSGAPTINAEKISKRVFSLPIYPELTDEEVQYVVDCIDSCSIN